MQLLQSPPLPHAVAPLAGWQGCQLQGPAPPDICEFVWLFLVAGNCTGSSFHKCYGLSELCRYLFSLYFAIDFWLKNFPLLITVVTIMFITMIIKFTQNLVK